MKCQISKMPRCNFKIRKFEIHRGHWFDLDIPEEVYEEIRNKLHDKPFIGIHGEILNSNRAQLYPTEVILDYLYCNGFDYLFE